MYNKIATLMLAGSLSIMAANAAELGQVSGVNQVRFHQAEYNNDFAGNGFLITHADRVLALTAKHVLFEAKTPQITHIDIDEQLASWRIHPLGQESQAVELGKLLNADANEKLDMQVLQNDWLMFEVKENKSGLQPLKLRTSPVKKGEVLTALGCTYALQAKCKQATYSGTFVSYGEHNLLIDLGEQDLMGLRGLSGAPVVDEAGLLVGIVSNVLPHPEGEGMVFAPARIEPLIDFVTTNAG